MTRAGQGSGRSLRQRWFAWVYPIVERRQRRHTASTRAALLRDLEGDVLDVGCGPGANFPHFGPKAVVTAVDYNPGMVTQAGRTLAEGRASDAIVAHIQVQQADATALPFEDASFDAYVSTLVLCSVPDLHAAVEEAWRVLRPGGALRLFEHVRSETPWRARLQRWLTPVWGLVADGCHLDRETHRVFQRRGFEVIEEQHPRIPAEPMPLVVMRARKPGLEATR